MNLYSADWHIIAVLSDVLLVVNKPIANRLFGIRGDHPQLGDAVDDVPHEVETIQVVHHTHIERRGCGSFFFVAANVQVIVICAAIREPMDQPGVTMVGKDNRFVLRENVVELAVGQTMRMLR